MAYRLCRMIYRRARGGRARYRTARRQSRIARSISRRRPRGPARLRHHHRGVSPFRRATRSASRHPPGGRARHHRPGQPRRRIGDYSRPVRGPRALPADLAYEIDDAYRRLGDDVAVAVRSSATAEDLPELSFAGQQETYLNVRGAEALEDAVRRCWASLWTARAIGYRANAHIPRRPGRPRGRGPGAGAGRRRGRHVHRQSRHGAREETVINAAWGLGEAIVSGLVTPDTLVVDKSSGTIKHQEIAGQAGHDRALGRRHQRTAGARSRAPPGRPLARASRRADSPRLDHRVSCTASRWTSSGRSTTRASPCSRRDRSPPCPSHRRADRVAAARPEGQVRPQQRDRVAARSALAALRHARRPCLEPRDAALLETVNLRGLMADEMIVHDQRLRLLRHHDDARDAQVHATATGAGARARATCSAMPRAAGRRWPDRATRASPRAGPPRTCRPHPRATCSHGAREIVQSAADHYLSIQSGILPAALHDRGRLQRWSTSDCIRRPGIHRRSRSCSASTARPIAAEKSLYDLAEWARSKPELPRTSSGPPATTSRATWSSADVVDGWSEFCTRFRNHLQQYGHAVYDLDFAKPLPAEEPAPVLEALKFFVGGSATNPYARQDAAVRAREDAMRTVGGRLSPPLSKLYAIAARARPALRPAARGRARRRWPRLARPAADAARAWPAPGRQRRARSPGRRVLAAAGGASVRARRRDRRPAPDRRPT